MRIAEVKKLKQPIDRLVYWITERESIRMKRAKGLPSPWTDDEILQKYRFCNVRRMDDRVSLWLLDNWYKPYIDHPNMLVAATLARQLNNPDSLGDLGFPERWEPSKAEKLLASRASQGKKNFSAAYMITGTLGGTKIQQIVHKVVTPIHESRPTINCCSMQLTAKALLPRAGFSHFMAGQVTADLRHAMSGSWKDRHTWAPMGPGSKRGLNRLSERVLMHPMKESQFLRELTDLIACLNNLVSQSIMKRLEAQDIQSCCCEWDKYERALWGQGKPKQLYRGGTGT